MAGDCSDGWRRTCAHQGCGPFFFMEPAMFKMPARSSRPSIQGSQLDVVWSTSTHCSYLTFASRYHSYKNSFFPSMYVLTIISIHQYTLNNAQWHATYLSIIRYMIHHGSDGAVPSSSKNVPKHNENLGARGKKDIGK